MVPAIGMAEELIVPWDMNDEQILCLHVNMNLREEANFICNN
jgi:hypothetical protein